MIKREKVYEGREKRLWTTDDEELLILEFKDEVHFQDGTSMPLFGKGEMDAVISAALFRFLQSRGMETHFVKHIGGPELLVKKLLFIPIEVVVRKIVAGTLVKRLNMEPGTELPFPIIEYYIKNEKYQDTFVNADHIRITKSATEGEVKVIGAQAREVFLHLQRFFKDRGMNLVDMKLEFGRFNDLIMLGDEIGPNIFRLWDATIGNQLDKERLLTEPQSGLEAWNELARRIGAG